MPPIRCPHAPSAAKLFLQLYTRRNASSIIPAASSSSLSTAAASNSGMILEVLLPSQARKSGLVQRATTATIRSTRRDLISAKRPFSTSPSLSRTLAIHNPQMDEDGSEMAMEITPRAAHRLSQIMTKDSNPHLALRIQVESGGCHGFQYLMSLTTLPPSLSSSSPSSSSAPETSDTTTTASTLASEIAPSTATSSQPSPSPTPLNEEDTIFAFTPDSDSSSALAPTPKIILDLPSLELLKGSKVDYTMELIGSQFKIVDNPLATSSCGCGTSFDIKI